MNRVRSLFVGLLLLAPAVEAQEAQRITFPQAVELALQRNVSLLQAENGILLDRAAVSDARIRFFPDLRFGVSGSTRFGASGDGRSLGTDLSSGVTLFDGLGNVARLREARLLAEAGLLDRDRVRQTVVFQVITGFLSIIEAQEQTRVREENLTAQEEQENLVRALVEEGERPVSDQYQQESNTAAARLALVEARRTLELARMDLEQVLDLDPLGVYVFEVPAVPEVDPEAPPILALTLVEHAFTERPDLRASSERLLAAGQGERGAKSERWPSLSLSAGYGADARSGSDDDFLDQLDTERSGSVGFSLSLPVFDRFATRNSVRRARVARDNATLVYQEQRREVALQVRRAVLDRNSAQEQLRAARARVAAADKALELTRERYEAGVATLVEVTLSRADRVAAESDEVSARYNLLWQDRLLDYYVGSLDPAEGLGSP